jgi:hypothetical protein
MTMQSYVVVDTYRLPSDQVETDYWLGPYMPTTARDVAADYTRDTGIPAKVVRAPSVEIYIP